MRGKTTLRQRLREQSAVIDCLIEKLEDVGCYCPFSNMPNTLGSACEMAEVDNNGKMLLPDYCSLRGYTSREGEHDEDCDGAHDGKSCWLHYYQVASCTPRKYTPKRRQRHMFGAFRNSAPKIVKL